MIIKNSVRLNIALNTKDKYGSTAFHEACRYGHSEISEMIIKNSVRLNIALNTKNNYGETAFHNACYHGRTSIIDMMIKNSESVNLTATDNDGKTGFQVAQE